MPRVLSWTVGLLWSGAALVAAAEAEHRPEAGASPHVVRLAWTDPVGITAGGWSDAAREVSRVLGLLGLQAESRAAPVSEPLRSDEVRVILVPGAPPRRKGGRRAIAAAYFTDSIPKVWVRLDGIAWILGASTPFHPLSAPPEVVLRFDRLLGRVVAHEVVHLVAPAISHGRGLMSACLDANEFLQPEVRIDPEIAVLVRTAVRAGPTAPGAHDADEGEAPLPAGP
jgi:hypothetical protein